MKKIILLLVIVFFPIQVFAQNIIIITDTGNAKDLSGFSAACTTKISKMAPLPIDVKFHIQDGVVTGQVNDFEIRSKGITYKDDYYSDVVINRKNLKSKYLNKKNRLVTAETPASLMLNAIFTQEDVEGFLAMENVKKALDKVSFTINEHQAISLKEFIAVIKNDKVTFRAFASANIFGAIVPIPVLIEAGAKIKENKLYLINLKIPQEVADPAFAVFVNSLAIPELEIVDFNKIAEKNKINLNISKLSIINDKINVEGKIQIP